MIIKIQVAPLFFLFYNNIVMKDPEGIILFIVGALAACAVFLGVITAIKKSFSTPKTEMTDSTEMISEQRRHAKEVADSQKRLIQDQKQKIRDLQRR
ncbi:MAG: hypothetical protein A3G91_01570 [Omnitrophica WOR_2 bacterium RIFCSPLOWO2_12_FULL_50_9]|nr:MAG: hypothetical protein A3D87_08485 [Omnitrophica WOR_2 bacterium RIFCSPHIGHO2_02_FULL_50_17]OGX40283.1 MAG: hypothetical protein A3G91_01570 [Omnitrophica WOR_2 bacterium RIFCSPLOWO2_12_FULL_50_9]